MTETMEEAAVSYQELSGGVFQEAIFSRVWINKCAQAASMRV